MFNIFVNKIRILYGRWSKLKPIKFIIISTILSLALTLPVYIVFEIFGIQDTEIGAPDFKDLGIAGIFIILVIIGPILETFLGQVLPIYLTQRFIKWKTNLIAVLISTILFSLGHLEYSVWYFILIMPTALTLSLTYLIFQKRSESGFWMTAAVHSLKNLIAFAVSIGDILK